MKPRVSGQSLSPYIVNFGWEITKDNKVIKRQKIATDIGRVRNVIQGNDGYIYFAVEQKGIFKIIPN